jgi:hypothetical protein
MTMTPFDSSAQNPQQIHQTKEPPTDAFRKSSTNKTGKYLRTPERRVAEELPPCWQGASPQELLLHGPASARFEEPPPSNPAPLEPEEPVGEELTPRQLAFCERYVECPVAARAAREAGYGEVTAAKQASRLLKHPLVMRRILELRRKHRLERAYRRESLLDKFELVFAEAIERKDFYAAIQALTMQARLSHIQEAMPGFRFHRRFENGAEQLVWDSVARLEQKLSEIAAGAFPGATAAAAAEPVDEAAAEDRAAHAVERLRGRRRK